MAAKRLLPLVPVLGVIAAGGLPCHWQAAPVAAQASGAQDVRVDLTEWSLSPARIQVTPGVVVRLLAANHGALAHALAVEGDGLYSETDTIGSGKTARLEVTFAAPGLYDIYCPIAAGQHRALGQDGKIAAGPEAAALLDDGAPADLPEAEGVASEGAGETDQTSQAPADAT